jgi:hypothetical protein
MATATDNDLVRWYFDGWERGAAHTARDDVMDVQVPVGATDLTGGQ